MLTSVAKKRAAEAKQRRRRGSGFAIIVFAGLALAGSALAATGVWSPLDGGHHQAQQSTQSSDMAGVQGGFARGVPIPPAGAHGRQRPNPNDGGPGGTPASQIVGPVVDGGDQGPASGDAGDHGPSSVGGADSTDPGESDVGGGRQVDPNHGPNGGPNGEPQQPPGEPPAPRPTRVSVFCGLEAETELNGIRCAVIVSGEAGAPSGQVSFEDPGPGRFSAGSCLLSDDGNGTSSSCFVEYAPALPHHEAVANYGGDGANAPSSTSFVV